jgi:hypothetical protein
MTCKALVWVLLELTDPTVRLRPGIDVAVARERRAAVATGDIATIVPAGMPRTCTAGRAALVPMRELVR